MARIRILLSVTIGLLVSGICAAQSVFDMPGLFPQHKRFLGQMLTASQQGDFLSAEAAARSAIKIFPDDATWHYNVACACAQQGRFDEAKQFLLKAIELGFADVNQLKTDRDLTKLRAQSGFDEVVKLAQTRAERPVSNKALAAATPLPVTIGTEAMVQASNTRWEWDPAQGGYFTMLFQLMPAAQTVQAYKGPYADLIQPWIDARTAAGNSGDLYVNRDEDLSQVRYDAFPSLTPVVYSEVAQQKQVHVGVANAIFSTGYVALPTVENSMSSFNRPPLWRSIPRRIDTDASLKGISYRMAMANQLAIYDAFVDMNTPQFGDLLLSRNPSFLISGKKGAERPDVQAQVKLTELVLAMMAAMKPDVKRAVLRRGALVSTVQMLLRSNVSKDYFSAAAHPIYFDPDTFDGKAVVKAAHDLTLAGVPPQFQLNVRQETMPLQYIDYFDIPTSEGLADTPSSILRIIRGNGYARKITVEAGHASEPGLKYKWFVVQGDSSKVRIHPLTKSGSLVTIEVDYQGDATHRRVDVACVAQREGSTTVSAPAFVSFRYLGNESRVYKAGKIQSIDYTAPDGKYVYEDPLIAAAKRWKDVYQYDANGQLIGWTRKREGKPDEEFDVRGRKIIARNNDGSPKTVQPVSYLPRNAQGDGILVPVIELLQSDDGAPVPAIQ